MKYHICKDFKPQIKSETLAKKFEHFKCSIGRCKLIFNKEGHLEQHVLKAHKGANLQNSKHNPQKCEFCYAVYVEKKTLNRHVKTVHAGRHKINFKKYEENVDTAVNSLTIIKTENPENEIHDPLAL